MSIEFFKRLMLYVVLVLSQALVLNHIHLFGYATPLLYIYFVVSFPRNYPKWGIILWSFLLGLNVDAFSNTPGVAATLLIRSIHAKGQRRRFSAFNLHDGCG